MLCPALAWTHVPGHPSAISTNFSQSGCSHRRGLQNPCTPFFFALIPSSWLPGHSWNSRLTPLVWTDRSLSMPAVFRTSCKCISWGSGERPSSLFAFLCLPPAMHLTQPQEPHFHSLLYPGTGDAEKPSFSPDPAGGFPFTPAAQTQHMSLLSASHSTANSLQSQCTHAPRLPRGRA